jgi:hypothetical protein
MTSSMKNKNKKSVPSAGKIVVTFFSDEKGLIMNFESRGITAKSDTVLNHEEV